MLECKFIENLQFGIGTTVLNFRTPIEQVFYFLFAFMLWRSRGNGVESVDFLAKIFLYQRKLLKDLFWD